jgi:hypothetical protein
VPFCATLSIKSLIDINDLSSLEDARHKLYNFALLKVDLQIVALSNKVKLCLALKENWPKRLILNLGQ